MLTTFTTNKVNMTEMYSCTIGFITQEPTTYSSIKDSHYLFCAGWSCGVQIGCMCLIGPAVTSHTKPISIYFVTHSYIVPELLFVSK